MNKQVEYNNRSRAKKRELGLVPIHTWVPAEMRKAILEVAKKMREGQWTSEK